MPQRHIFSDRYDIPSEVQSIMSQQQKKSMRSTSTGITLMCIIAINALLLYTYRKLDSEGSPDWAEAHYEKQMSARFEYLNNVKGEQWNTLYTVIVPEVFCPYSVRVGSVNDGGKYVCTPGRMPRGHCSVYSLGINGDISFDREIQAFNNNRCRIFGYDKDVQPEEVKSLYQKINGNLMAAEIAPVTRQEANNYTLGDLVKRNNDSSVEFLKMDIEYAEHDVLIPFLEEYRVCQIFVEIHGEAQQQLHLVRRIALLNYGLFSCQPNAHCRHCCEYSFIHRDCMQKYGASISKLYLKDLKPALLTKGNNSEF